MNKSFKLNAAAKLVLMAGVAATLAACGGGSDSPAPVATTPPPPPPPAVSYAITLSGTAATGASIANAAVTANCKVGTATATTAADGSYTLRVAAPGEGPCILAVTQNGVTLRSVASGDGAKVNITPLTEMLVSYIAVSSGAGANATPAELAINNNVNTVVTNATMFSATVNRVVQIISTATGGAVAVPTDFLSATLVPKSATNPGNAQDAVLEALKARNVVSANGAPVETLLTTVRNDAATNTVTGGAGNGGN